MRVILGLPNAAKLSDIKDGCNPTQGQGTETREVPLSRKEEQKCDGSVLPSLRWIDSAEGSDDDCSMQSLIVAEEEGSQSQLGQKSESSKVSQERGCHGSSTSSLGERDCLLNGVKDALDSVTGVQGPGNFSLDSIMNSGCQTDMNSRNLQLPEQHFMDTKDKLQDCIKKCSESHLKALPSSYPQCPSARMSSPILPSLSPIHPNGSLLRIMPGSPPTATTFRPIRSNHSICSTAEHSTLFHQEEQTLSKCIGGTSLSICEPEECLVIMTDNDLEDFHESRSPRTQSCLQQCEPSGPKGMSVISMTSFGSRSSGEGPICRICHEGPLSDDGLLAPCHCSGTLTYQHRKCLERWLQTRGKDACELCDYHFKTERKGRPFSEWIQQPERIRDRRNILVDCSCFTLLTPLVCISTWLCVNGAYHYLNYYEGRGWEGMGLVTLATVLIFIYLFWSLMSLRYHCIVWRTWRKEHQRVHVVMETGDSQNNNNDISISSASSSSSKKSKVVGSSAASRSSSMKTPSSCTSSPRSLDSFTPSWTSPCSYSNPLHAPLASMTSL
ncbi:uncharacterized protein LOC121415188 [Lytechinus variegatus]|uniref:uncharacterized protein LOC121415188 n=1 Tax=Lytechinus variegatus TaxID=7654 RepID=UPI001BB2C9FC|nr:uncharacterized protein LOC121415188 [Lytechinus variegatus]